MGWVLMSEREVHRIEVLSSAVSGRMSTSEAAAVLCLSDRQVQRLLRTFREDGAIALRHKACARPSRPPAPRGPCIPRHGSCASPCSDRLVLGDQPASDRGFRHCLIFGEELNNESADAVTATMMFSL